MYAEAKGGAWRLWRRLACRPFYLRYCSHSNHIEHSYLASFEGTWTLSHMSNVDPCLVPYQKALILQGIVIPSLAPATVTNT